MSTDHDQKRQPKGAPASIGGQWARDDHRAASRISLDPGSRDALQKLRPLVTAMVGRKFGNRVDPDEVLSRVYETAAVRLRDGAWNDVEANMGYLVRAAQNTAITLAYADQESYERSANVKLAEREAEMQNRIGREVTDAERAELADEIRRSYPPRRRPRIGWHAREGNVSIDAVVTDADRDNTLAAGLRHVEQEPMSIFDVARAQLEDSPGMPAMDIAEMRARYWALVRQDDDRVPPVAADVAAERADDAAKAVKRRGAMSLVHAWEEDGDAQDAERLFAPWGGVAGTTPSQREAIVEVLGRAGRRSDAIWMLALEGARR